MQDTKIMHQTNLISYSIFCMADKLLVSRVYRLEMIIVSGDKNKYQRENIRYFSTLISTSLSLDLLI